MTKRVLIVTLNALFGVILFLQSCSSDPKRVLIFTKTNTQDGFRHESIEAGIKALTVLGDELGYIVEHSEDAALITEEKLKDLKAIIFLNTSRNILDYSQQCDFERFIQAGGGFIGIHGASTTEYDWPWYGKLVGAYFQDHPEIQTATLQVVAANHPSTDPLPGQWTRTDEWYNFRQISKDINVVLTIDETSYEGGKNGDPHPMAWYHEFDGGLSYYTALGHTIESYEEPLFRKHLKGALEFVVENVESLDYYKASTKRPCTEQN